MNETTTAAAAKAPHYPPDLPKLESPKDWNQWKTNVRIILHQSELLDYMTTSKPPNWSEKDDLTAYGVMYMGLGSDLAKQWHVYKNSADLWSYLTAKFELIRAPKENPATAAVATATGKGSNNKPDMATRGNKTGYNSRDRPPREQSATQRWAETDRTLVPLSGAMARLGEFASIDRAIRQRLKAEQSGNQGGGHGDSSRGGKRGRGRCGGRGGGRGGRGNQSSSAA